MEENNSTQNDNQENNFDTLSIIEELKKLKPVEKEYRELIEKTEELILNQYNTIQRLAKLCLKTVIKI